MFEEYNFENLMERMLSNVPENLDKREGSIIWDALAPVALELSNFYINLDMVLDECFADTASYYYLIKRAAERGLYPKEATKTILKMKVTPLECEVLVGTRFNLDMLNYIVLEKIENGVYRVECEEEGIIGNQQLGTLIPLEYVDGLENATLTEVLVPGEEEEDEEVFRERYFESFQSKAFGGNIADYKEQIKKMDGIGGVKVYPAWNGGGTVKAVLISSEYKAPSSDLIEQVQKEIDPTDHSGEGIGLAPIGHIVTIFGVKGIPIHVSAKITYQNGMTFEILKNSIEDAIDGYLASLSLQWEHEINLVVRVSQMEALLLNIDGVIDVENTKLNEKAENFILGPDEIPVRGEIVG